VPQIAQVIPKIYRLVYYTDCLTNQLHGSSIITPEYAISIFYKRYLSQIVVFPNEELVRLESITPKHMTAAAKKTSFSDESNAHLWAFLVAYALLSAGLLIGMFIDDSRSWGFHFLRYFSSFSRVAFVAIGVAAAAIVWRSEKNLHSSFPKIRLFTGTPLAADLAAAILSVILFSLLRAATPVLGDGQLWINEIADGSVPVWNRRGPLTLALYDFLYRSWNASGNLDPQSVFRACASLAGGIAVFSWLRSARLLNVPVRDALLLAALWGGIAQFFGYVELYAPMIALVSVMLWWIIASPLHGKFCWMVPVLALAAPGFHFIAITFLPAAALYVWWSIARRLPKSRALIAMALVGFALAGILYFVLGWHHGTNILLPLWPHAGWNYAVFSGKHLFDLVNGLALSLGPGIVLLVVLWRRPLSDTEKSSVRTILTAALLVPFAAFVMHNPQLGMARDWDIGSALLCAVPFALFLGWNSPGTSSRLRRWFRAGAAFWICAVIVPWLSVQASESRSIRRFEDLLRLDREKSATGWDYLGGYYGRRGDLKQVGRCYQEAVRLTPNIRYHRSLAIFYASQRDWPGARREAELVADSVFADSVVTDWEAKMVDFRPFLKAAGEFMSRGDYDNAHQMYLLAATIHPQSRIPYLAIAALLIRASQFHRVEEVFRELLAADASCGDEVRTFFSTLSRQSGGALEEHIGLAIFSRVSGNLPDALTHLDQARTIAPNDESIHSYRQEIAEER